MKVTITIHARCWIQVFTHLRNLLADIKDKNFDDKVSNGQIYGWQKKKEYGSLKITMEPEDFNN